MTWESMWSRTMTRRIWVYRTRGSTQNGKTEKKSGIMSSIDNFIFEGVFVQIQVMNWSGIKYKLLYLDNMIKIHSFQIMIRNLFKDGIVSLFWIATVFILPFLPVFNRIFPEFVVLQKLKLFFHFIASPVLPVYLLSRYIWDRLWVACCVVFHFRYLFWLCFFFQEK